MLVQFKLLGGPDIEESAAGQDNLPSRWVEHTLLSLAHDAVEELAGLVHLGKIPDSLGTDMMLVYLAVVVTAHLGSRKLTGAAVSWSINRTVAINKHTLWNTSTE